MLVQAGQAYAHDSGRCHLAGKRVALAVVQLFHALVGKILHTLPGGVDVACQPSLKQPAFFGRKRGAGYAVEQDARCVGKVSVERRERDLGDRVVGLCRLPTAIVVERLGNAPGVHVGIALHAQDAGERGFHGHALLQHAASHVHGQPVDVVLAVTHDPQLYPVVQGDGLRVFKAEVAERLCRGFLVAVEHGSYFCLQALRRCSSARARSWGVSMPMVSISLTPTFMR